MDEYFLSVTRAVDVSQTTSKSFDYACGFQRNLLSMRTEANQRTMNVNYQCRVAVFKTQHLSWLVSTGRGLKVVYVSGGGRDSNKVHTHAPRVGWQGKCLFNIYQDILCPGHPTEVDKNEWKFENVLSLIHTLYSVTKWMSIFYL